MYSKSHYNILISSRSSFILHDLMSSHISSFFGFNLIDGCVFPEKITMNTDDLKNGSGLFGVNYDHLERYIYIQAEKTILACNGDEECDGAIPSNCELIYVKSVI